MGGLALGTGSVVTARVYEILGLAIVPQGTRTRGGGFPDGPGAVMGGRRWVWNELAETIRHERELRRRKGGDRGPQKRALFGVQSGVLVRRSGGEQVRAICWRKRPVQERILGERLHFYPVLLVSGYVLQILDLHVKDVADAARVIGDQRVPKGAVWLPGERLRTSSAGRTWRNRISTTSSVGQRRRGVPKAYMKLSVSMAGGRQDIAWRPP
jgi:hypothetical protein